MRANVGPIKGRKGASLEFDFRERMQSPWDDNVEFVEPVTAKVRLVNTGRGFIAAGEASARSSIVCDRCLEPFTADLTARFEQEFRKGSEPLTARERAVEEIESKEGDGPDDEDEFRAFDGDTIDLDETVAEAFLLAAPVKFLCRDDCRGMCPVCGANLNVKACGCKPQSVDPRLADLAKLLEAEGHD